MRYFEIYKLLCLNVSEITWLTVATNSLPLLLASVIIGIVIDRLVIGRTIPAVSFLARRKKSSVAGAFIGAMVGAGLMLSAGRHHKWLFRRRSARHAAGL